MLRAGSFDFDWPHADSWWRNQLEARRRQSVVECLANTVATVMGVVRLESTSVSWESSTGEFNVFIDGELTANGLVPCMCNSKHRNASFRLTHGMDYVFFFTTVNYCGLAGPHIFLILRSGTSGH